MSGTISHLLQTAPRKKFAFGTIFYLPTTTKGQIAVIVPKRVAKHATKRNRMKRLVKESLRKLAVPGDIVVLLHKALPDTQAQVQVILQHAL